MGDPSFPVFLVVGVVPGATILAAPKLPADVAAHIAEVLLRLHGDTAVRNRRRARRT